MSDTNAISPEMKQIINTIEKQLNTKVWATTITPNGVVLTLKNEVQICLHNEIKVFVVGKSTKAVKVRELLGLNN